MLLDDDFATIVAAVEQGRATFANIRRFLTYHLTDNVAELTPFVVWALSGGRFPLALGVLQILALDIGTDLLPALALGAEPPNAARSPDRPIGRHLIDAALLRRVFGVLGPTEAVMEMAAFVVALAGRRLATGRQRSRPATPCSAASGAAFAAVVIGQIGQRVRLPERDALAGPWDGPATGSCSAPSQSSWRCLPVSLLIGPVASFSAPGAAAARARRRGTRRAGRAGRRCVHKLTRSRRRRARDATL